MARVAPLAVECVRTLITSGVDLDDIGGNGFTALTSAATYGNEECVKMLIEAGADVNCFDNEDTPVMCAALKGRLGCLKLLIEAGADVNECDEEASAVFRAAARGHVECFRLLVEAGADVNLPDGEGTPLYYAVIEGHVPSLKLLLDAGADVNKSVESHNLRTPVFWAAALGKVECLKLLIEAGADINVTVKKYDGANPLIAAALEGYSECLNILLDAGVDVNSVDQLEQTALINAIHNGRVECVETLIQRGADVNAGEDEDKRNPLIEAINEDQTECVVALVKGGAKLITPAEDEPEFSWLNMSYHTNPIWTAASMENFPMFEALIEAGGDIKEGIFTAAYHGFYEAVKLLIEKGADVNWSEDCGNTVLLLAAYARMSLNYGFDCSPPVAKRVLCVKLVLQSGASVNQVNVNNETALERSINNSPMKCTKNLAHLLFAAGEKIRKVKPKSSILRNLKTQENGLTLMAICRKYVRKHLLEVDPHLNLFKRVSKLEVPHTLIDYILFDRTLDVNESYDEEENEDIPDNNGNDDDNDDYEGDDDDSAQDDDDDDGDHVHDGDNDHAHDDDGDYDHETDNHD